MRWCAIEDVCGDSHGTPPAPQVCRAAAQARWSVERALYLKRSMRLLERALCIRFVFDIVKSIAKACMQWSYTLLSYCLYRGSLISDFWEHVVVRDDCRILKLIQFGTMAKRLCSSCLHSQQQPPMQIHAGSLNAHRRGPSRCARPGASPWRLQLCRRGGCSLPRCSRTGLAPGHTGTMRRASTVHVRRSCVQLHRCQAAAVGEGS